MRTRTFTTLALAGSLVLFAAACSSDGDDASETTPSETSEVTEDSVVDDSTSVPDGTQPEEASPSTLAPGEPIRVTAPSQTVEGLSEECAAAVAGLRDIFSRYDSGLQITADDAALFNEAISAPTLADASGEKPCSDDEFREFNEKELQPWLTPPPTVTAVEGDAPAGDGDETPLDEQATDSTQPETAGG